MKPKRLLVAILCIAMLAGSVTAFAAGGYSEYGEHDYSAEGLKPVLANNAWGYFNGEHGAPEDVWNYVDKSGKVLDLNQGRFECMFEFYDGMAAVVEYETGKVGYINATGKLVIPCQFGAYYGFGDQFAGYFKDGIAPVLETGVSYDADLSENATYKLGYINKTGKLVKPYVTVVNDKGVSGLGGLAFLGDNGWVLDAIEEAPETTLNQSIYTTTSFEVYNPLGYFDAIASEHRVHYKLESKTTSVDQVDIVVIPCVVGGSFNFDGSMHLISDRYYPLPIAHIQATLEPGETVRGHFNPEWGWDSDMLKYVVIKLDPGDMELLQENGIGGWDKDSTYHPSGRTETENKLASDFVHKYFSDYLK